MAKVLISPLGVGYLDKDAPKREYKKAFYKFDCGEEYYTPFISAALSRYLEVDKIFLIGTGKSMWEEVYRYFTEESGQKPDQKYWMELGEKVEEFKVGESQISQDFLVPINKAIDYFLQKLRPSATGGSQCHLIAYGVNEEELWQNFEIFMRISDALENGDEIYLDITHSFRSIPLFMYLMLDFIKTLNTKEIELSGIYYGMLDVKNEFNDKAPVVDLGPLFKISQWIKGAYDFITYGNGYMIANLLDNEIIAGKVKNVSELVNINYLTDLKREVDSLDYYLQGNVSQLPVLKYMAPYIEDFVGRFRGLNSNGKFQFQLARWYFENHRYASGYICLTESIVTRVMEVYRDSGAKVKMTIGGRNEIKYVIERFSLEPTGSLPRQIYDEYDKLRTVRNIIAHAGFYDRSSFEQDIKNAESHIKVVNKLLFNNNEIKKIPEMIPYVNKGRD